MLSRSLDLSESLQFRGRGQGGVSESLRVSLVGDKERSAPRVLDKRSFCNFSESVQTYLLVGGDKEGSAPRVLGEREVDISREECWARGRRIQKKRGEFRKREECWTRGRRFQNERSAGQEGGGYFSRSAGREASCGGEELKTRLDIGKGSEGLS